MRGYCIKCHEMRDIEDFHKITDREGKRWSRGDCPVCGTAVWQRLREEETDRRLIYASHLG